jgi:hypothetical protein
VVHNGSIEPTQIALILAAAAGALLVAALVTRGRLALVLVAAGLSVLLAALTIGMSADWLVGIDTALENWSDKHRTDRRGEMAKGIWATLGSPRNAFVVAVVCGALLSFIERRLLGWWQDRYGPNRVGPFGMFQIAADMIKMFFKEDWTPPFADRFIFILAPMIAFSAMLMSS